jgi:hypothetical protein
MLRERVLKVVLVAIGLLFTAGIYPLIGSLLHPIGSDTGDTMMLSLYVTLGIMLLACRRAKPLGASQPDCFRSLVEFCSRGSNVHARPGNAE